MNNDMREWLEANIGEVNGNVLTVRGQGPAIGHLTVDSNDDTAGHLTLSWADKAGTAERCPGNEPRCDWAVPHTVLTLTVKAARDLHQQLTEELADYPDA